MVTGRKEIIFFVLLIFIMYFTGMIPLLLNSINGKLNPYYVLIVTCVLSSLYLMLIYSGNNMSSQRDDFLFELTPAKICDGGAYMATSGWRRDFCNNFMNTEEGQKQYSMYNSSGGFVGRPLNNKKFNGNRGAGWGEGNCKPDKLLPL